MPSMPRIAASVQRPSAACVIFFADGLSQAVLKRMLAAGELPAIDRLFARGGVEIENAIVCLPSLTYANAVSLITGLFPGHHGILGNQWYDPATHEYRDYGGPLTYRRVNADIRHPTLYDLLDDHFTLNVQCHTRKGVKHTIDQDISSGILWGLGMYERVDRRVGDVLPRVARTIERDGRWPIVWMNYFPGLDEIGHRCGPDSAQYAAAVRNVDAQVARIAAFAQENAGGERLFLAFVTDHGMVATPEVRAFDLRSDLRRKRGVDFRRRPIRWPGLHRSAFRPDGVAIAATDRSMVIHDTHREAPDSGPCPCGRFRHMLLDGGSHCRELRPLEECEFVEAICERDAPDRVRVRTRARRFWVERQMQAGRTMYRIDLSSRSTRSDGSLIALAELGWMASREWLAHTAQHPNPDFVVQFANLFDHSRSGNLMLFAADDWSFDQRFVAGHGSCAAADMRVSHFYAGPGLPAGGKVHAARLVDVMPTLLDLLGHHDRLAQIGPIDGVSIRRELESAASV